MKRGIDTEEENDVTTEVLRYKCKKCPGVGPSSENSNAIVYVSHEPGSSLFGLSLWPGARALADFIVDNGHIFAGKRVVELGAGPGLPGLVAAVACGADVLLTDVGSEILTCCRENVGFNSVEAQCGVDELDWTIPGAAKAVVEKRWKDAKVDIILASDCIYDDDKDVHEDFVAVIAELLCLSVKEDDGASTAVAYVSYFERNCERSIAHLLRLWGLDAKFIDVRTVEDDSRENDDDDDCSEIHVHIVEIRLASRKA